MKLFTTLALITLANLPMAFGAIPQTFKTDVIFDGNISIKKEVDAVQASTSDTGNLDAINTTGVYQLRLTGAGATVRGFAGGRAGKELLVFNGTGGEILITNNAGASATNRILTGTGKDLKMKANSAYRFAYDGVQSRWVIAGGGGGGTEIQAQAPIAYDPETTVLSIPPATTSVNGYMPKEAQTAINNNTTRLTAEEAATLSQASINTANTTKNNAQDGRLDIEEGKSATQATYNTNNDTKNTTQDGRLTAEEGKSTAQAATNTAQTTYNTNNDTKNTAQDGRLTAEESATAAQAITNTNQTAYNSTNDGKVTALQNRTATERGVSQTAHGFVAGNIIRHNGTAFVKSQADSDANSEVAGMVAEVYSANDFKLVSEGYLTGLSGLTPGATYRLSPTIAGAMQVATPTVANQIDKPVFNATAANAGFFIQSRGITVAGPPFTNPQTTKGDLIAHDGSVPARVPVGNAGEVLTADPTSASGVSYKKAAGGSRNYVKNPSADVSATTDVTYTNVTAGRNTTAPVLGDTGEFSFLIDSATDRVVWNLDPFSETLKNIGLCNVEIPFKADTNAENVQWELWRAGGTVPIKQGRFYNPGGTNPGVTGGGFLCGDLSAATELRVQGTSTFATNLKIGGLKITAADASKDQLGESELGVWTYACNANFSFGVTEGDASNVPTCTYTMVRGDASELAAPTTARPGLQFLKPDPMYSYSMELSNLLAGPDQVNTAAEAGFKLWDGTTISVDRDGIYYGGSSTGRTLMGRIKGTFAPISTVAATIRFRGFSANVPNAFIGATGTITVKKVPRSQFVFNVKNQSGDYDPVPYYPLFNGGATFNNVLLMQERKGKFLQVTGQALTVSMNGNSAYFTLPAGLEIDFDALGTPATALYNKIVGTIIRAANTSTQTYVIALPGTPNMLGVGISQSGSNNPFSPQNWNSVFGNGEALSFDFRVPIKGWTKSNVATNIAGEPGSYSTVLQADANSWTFTGATPVDVAGGTNISKLLETNNNFGTVTCGTSGLAACTITPKLTGAYDLVFNTSAYANSAGNGITIALYDGANNLISVPGSGSMTSAGGFYQNLTASTIVNLVTGVPFTFKLKGAASNGAGTLAQIPGYPKPMVAFTLKPITQNLKLDSGGNVGRSEALLYSDAGAGSSTPQARNFGTATNFGADLLAATSAVNGATITVQPGGEGLYTIIWNGPRFSSVNTMQITKNSSSYLTSGFANPLGNPAVLAIFDGVATNSHLSQSVTAWLVPGDVIRAIHFDNNTTATNPLYQYLRVYKVAK